MDDDAVKIGFWAFANGAPRAMVDSVRDPRHRPFWLKGWDMAAEKWAEYCRKKESETAPLVAQWDGNCPKVV